MKKAVIIIIVSILLIATVFFVINYKNYQVVTEGLITKPIGSKAVATWNAAKGLYMSITGDFGYNLCTCPPSDRCPDYPPNSPNAYHKYFPHGANGEYLIEVNYEFFYFVEVDGTLYKDISFESISQQMTSRWELHNLINEPKLPELPSLNEYTNGADNILEEAAGFFQWFGNAFLYIFKLIGYLWDTLVYYLEYVKIFFEVLTL